MVNYITMRKTVVISLLVIASLAVTAGIGRAAGYFTIDGSIAVDSLRVGKQGVGGVTFFNGTIVNQTTAADGSANPVTFGDDVRIDGRLHRGITPGPTDGMPFIVNDDLHVTGAVTSEPALANAITSSTWRGNAYYMANGSVITSSELTLRFSPSSSRTGTWHSSPVNAFNPSGDLAERSGSYLIVDDVLFATYSVNGIPLGTTAVATVREGRIIFDQTANNAGMAVFEKQ